MMLWVVTGSPIPQGLDLRATLVFCASGFLGLAVCDTFLMRSLLDIGPQRMTLVFLAVPVLTGLAAILPPWSEMPPPMAWAGMLVCLFGITMAVLRHADKAVDPVRFKRGVRNAALAAVFQSAAILLARYGLSVHDAPILDSAVVRMAAGTFGLAFMGLLIGRLGAWTGELRRKKAALMLFAASFFGTFLGILTNQFGVAWAKHTGVATTLNSLMPIYLMPLSMLFLEEKFGKHEVLATVIAVTGIALMMLGS
jgi:drug/metabolite transporter (DMT)-like permease